jgi:DNA glycosylase AlkZ-like
VTAGLPAAGLRRARAAAQLLAGEPATDPVAAVARVVAVQAQAPGPARLALRPRTTAVTAGDVDRACDNGTLVRTWAMRGTLHMLAAGDARWVTALLGPVFARAGRRRREQLGLDEATCQRALAAIERSLRGGEPLTRAALVARIREHGIAIDPGTQAPPHLLGYAANSGLICRGPDTSRGEPAYVLLEQYVPAAKPLSRQAALAELARRYLAGYGPATAADFRAWSGLPAAEARQAFAALSGEAAEVTAAGERMLVRRDAAPCPPAVPARLLGHFDALLLGYRDRDLILERAYARRVQAGGGIIRPTVLAGGEVAGTWSLERKGAMARAVVRPFGDLPPGSREGLAAETSDLGRFLGHPVELVMTEELG